MAGVFTEENGKYRIDCAKALWGTDEIHEVYHKAGIHLNDVDWVIETEDNLLLVEYKNANIEGADNPEGFQPESEKKITVLGRKYYDSLLYLALKGKDKPKRYIYIVEYPNSDLVTRKRLRNRIKAELPFILQNNLDAEGRAIEEFEVLSIAEWNADGLYGNFPLLPVDALKTDA